MNSVLPHLQRVMDAPLRLAQSEIERRASLAVLEGTQTAILVVARDGRILFASRGAEAILREADAICTINGCVRAVSSPAAERLTAILQRAMAVTPGSAVGAALAIFRPERLPLTLLVVPFRSEQGCDRTPAPAAIMFIKDPERSAFGVAPLQEMFGLTAAEAALAAGLVEGKSVEDIATDHRISLNTARTQLKAIFAKTSTNRQAQLVSMLARTVAALCIGGNNRDALTETWPFNPEASRKTCCPRNRRSAMGCRG
jgi:DNA-binding CsgD family transcriptional regulator